MNTVGVKCDWTRLDEPNGGHTPNEWGMQKPENGIKKIIAYKLSYEQS